MRRLLVIVVVVYAWWVTGIAPFTTASYVLVGVPWAVTVVAYARVGYFSRRRGDVVDYFGDRAIGVTWRTTTAWLVLLVAAVALECVGLALGGHSARVPTLSDAVDRLLDWHVGRCALFCLWIAVAARPLQRRRRWRMRRVA